MRPPGVGRRAAVVALAAVVAGAATAADWPGFLGPGRDGVAPDSPPLGWSGDAPSELWRQPLGSGWSGPIVVGDRVLVFHREGDAEVLEARSRTDGAPLWRSEQPTAYRDDFGFDDGPRATPEARGGRVVTLGAQGRLTSRQLEDGAVAWTVDLRERYGAEKIFFGVGASPLVVDDLVVAPVGAARAEAGLVAFDAGTGAERWRATDHEVSYSSPIALERRRRSRIVAWTREGVVELEAATGKLRSFVVMKSRLRSSVQAATPIVVNDRVLVTASYGVGASLLDLRSGDLDLVWSTDYALSSHFSTPVAFGNVVVGFHGRQEAGGELRAVKTERGEVAWTYEGTGVGSLIRARDDLVVVTEKGELILAPFDKKEFVPRQSAQVLRPVVRAQPALSGGLLVARDAEGVVAFDLRRPSPDAAR